MKAVDHVVHATHVDVLVVANKAHRLRLQLDDAVQHLAILDGVDVTISASDGDPVLNIIEAEDGDKGWHRIKLNLRCNVQCGAIKNVEHLVLSAKHEHADGSRLVHVLPQHLHARYRRLLLQQAILYSPDKLCLLLGILHGQKVNGVVRKHRAIFTSCIQLLIGRSNVDGILLDLLPHIQLSRVDVYGRQRELQIWSHVAVDEDLVPTRNGQSWNRWRSNLVVEALDSTRRIQQLLLPLDRRALVDANALLEVNHNQPVVPLGVQVGQAHE
mmetsp:Transcript_17326/g.47072  ORF Transcript_17326/g.47072 Transcript_17326/m.47072 type:complete len:271 (+) Transcript_17326:937-1749(+)